MRVIKIVRTLDLPDCLVAAGFVRNVVWDSVHGIPPQDIDIIWFDAAHTDRTFDKDLERKLLQYDEGLRWSVKNQARMHIGNKDSVCLSSTDIAAHFSAEARFIHTWPICAILKKRKPRETTK